MSQAMAFELNRIDGTLSLASLRADNFSIDEEEAMIELSLTAKHYMELYVPARDGIVEPYWLELATDLMTHLTEMDNQVQQSSAEQWKVKGQQWPSSYYEGELSFARFTGPDQVTLRYTVIGCNSEWDEQFVRVQGKWVRKT